MHTVFLSHDSPAHSISCALVFDESRCDILYTDRRGVSTYPGDLPAQLVVVAAHKRSDHRTLARIWSQPCTM